MEDATKPCPYCGETILATAIKCKYCGEWLAEKSSIKAPQPVVAPTVAMPAEPPTTEETPAAPAASADDKDNPIYISKPVRILVTIEFIIAIALLLIIFHPHIEEIKLSGALGVIVFIVQLLRDKTERGEACFGVSIPWAVLGLGIDLDWVSAIICFFLSFGINYGIITVIMKNERKAA